MPDFIDFKLVGHWWTRTNERHLALQNVPELEKLVQARFAKESTDRRHTRIVRDLVNHGLPWFAYLAVGLTSNESLDVLLMDFGVVVREHRAELQTLKASSKLSKPFLLENHGALGRKLDCHGNCSKQRAGNEEQEGASCDINHPLHNLGKVLS